eukprot:scaffold158485_cov20-Tisochrysis_lutea.AAC.2
MVYHGKRPQENKQIEKPSLFWGCCKGERCNQGGRSVIESNKSSLKQRGIPLEGKRASFAKYLNLIRAVCTLFGKQITMDDKEMPGSP